MSRDTVRLPEGDLCALTWEIPPQFGGLTKSMLQRSCQISTHFGRDVRVLTLAHQPDLDEIRADLRHRGLLVPGVTIDNLWEDLLEWSDADLESAPFDSSVNAPEITPSADGVLEVCRPDGTVLVRQRWLRIGDRPPLTLHGDQVARTEVWSRDGRFLGGWHGTWSLWRWWLRRTLGPGPAQVIVDSGFVADSLAAAPLPGVPATYVVHNGHITVGRDVPYGRLERRRAYGLTRSVGFDAVVYLTDTQRRDVELLRGVQGNAHVLPHAIELAKPITRSPSPRPGAGIAMANIDGRKRLDHAARAVAQAAKSEPNVDLRIYGRGAGLDALLETVKEVGAPVTVEGYTADPAAALRTSSFMLLTSSREGFGLVLVEAMAAGSIPISYDIPYGPSDIIRDGVDGFLLPDGDIEALAAKIVEVATTRRGRLRKLRRAARRRAQSFAPEAILPRWANVLNAAAARAADRSTATDPDADELADLERVAALYRLRDCRLEATLMDLSWKDSYATAAISCVVAGAGELTGPLEVSAELVHRPTGLRIELPTRVVTGPDDKRAQSPTVSVEIDIDPTELPTPLDHVVLVHARLGPVEVSDTVVATTSKRGWLNLPPAWADRPVMVIDRRAGLRLVTASPHVAADMRLDTLGATVEVTALRSDAKVEAIEASGMGDTTTVAGVALGSQSFQVRLSDHGRWKLRARIDGRWRDVAWRGPGNPPDPVNGLSVELTARGYVRFRRQQ